MRTRVFLAIWILAGAAQALPVGPVRVAVAEPEWTNAVTIEDRTFQPPAIRILQGSNVTWTNQDPIQEGTHSVTSKPNQEDAFEADPILPGPFAPAGLNQATIPFEVVGIFLYECKYHAGMAGVVEVVDPAALQAAPVAATDDLFEPALLRVNESQPVRWNTLGNATHRLEFEATSIGELGDLVPGASLEWDPVGRGSYRYRCVYHSVDFEDGMVGKVVVGEQRATFPPVVRIATPRAGALVWGHVNVTGLAVAGPESAPVSLVEVRVGEEGPWTAPAQLDYNATVVVWEYAWNTSAWRDGTVTVYARALNPDHHHDANVRGVLYEVANARAASDDSGAKEAARRPIPGPGFALVGLVVGLAFLVQRRP